MCVRGNNHGRITRLTALVLFAFFATPIAWSCDAPPAPPVCGKTVVFTKIPPIGPVFTDDATFDIPATIYVATTLACGDIFPTEFKVNMTMTCGGVTTPITQTVPLSEMTPCDLGFPFFYCFDITIPVPSPVVQTCTVTGSATVTFSDGMEITVDNNNETPVCIVDELPDTPNTPRLDLTLDLDDDPGTVDNPVFVHPGGQVLLCYRATNLDPTETFTGTLRIGMENAPGPPPPLPLPPIGPFSPSGLQGDHPPVVMLNDLMFENLNLPPQNLPPLPCLPLPPEPALTIPRDVEQKVVLAPGETRRIYALTRTWGGCSNGTCAESTSVLEGTFSGGDPGLACAGGVIANTIFAEPQLDWLSDGQRGFGVIPDPLGDLENDPTRLDFFGTVPTPDGPRLLEMGVRVQVVDVEGNPFNENQFMVPRDPLLSKLFDGMIFRHSVCMPLPLADPLIEGTMQFDFFDPIPDDNTQIQIEIVGLDLVSVDPIQVNSPTHRFDLAISVQDPMEGNFNAFAQVYIQSQANLGLASSCPYPVLNPDFQLNLFDGIPFQNVFAEGFENGDLSSWSATIPQRGLEPTEIFTMTQDIRVFLSGEAPAVLGPCDTQARDLNGDGLVSMNDVRSEQLADWASPNTGPEDQDGDGNVTVADMIQVLGSGICHTQPARAVKVAGGN